MIKAGQEQLTREQRKALYWANKGKKQVLPHRVLFRSLRVEVVRAGDRAKAELPIYRYHPATAIKKRDAKRGVFYAAVEHEPYTKVAA